MISSQKDSLNDLPSSFIKRMNQSLTIRMSEPEFNYFVTVNFNLPNSNKNERILQDLQMMFDDFHYDIDKKLFGRHFYRYQALSSHRTKYFGFPEHLESNLHVHLRMSVCEAKREKFEECFPKIINKRFPSASVDISYLHTQEDRAKTSSYCMKEQFKLRNQDYTIQSHPTEK